ncbi:MAG: acyl-CoA thioesterase [Myxococcales bacterium]|nr:acyl-CoA thioesterase [Myxococcales bacterium]
MPDRNLSLRVILLPKDTNAHGTIFGGVILSYIDLAGADEARRHTAHRVVTVAMNEVVFHHPVYVGDAISFYTRVVKIGISSITVNVDVEVTRNRLPDPVVRVTSATVVYVAINEHGDKIAVRAVGSV